MDPTGLVKDVVQPVTNFTDSTDSTDSTDYTDGRASMTLGLGGAPTFSAFFFFF